MRFCLIVLLLPYPLVAASCATVSQAKDPYAWLEQVDDVRALSWTRTRNEETAKRFAADATFAELQGEALKILNSTGRIPHVEQKGSHLYNLWRDSAHPRGLFRRTSVEQFVSADPQWETVVDIDKLSREQNERWVFEEMNCLQPAEQMCLVHLSRGGSDAHIIREFDAKTLRFIDGGFELPQAKSNVTWLDEDHLLVGMGVSSDALTDSGYPRRVTLWTRGTPLDSAQLIYEGQKKSVSVTTVQYYDHSSATFVNLLTENVTYWSSLYFHLQGASPVALHIPADAVVEDYYKGGLVILVQSNWQVGGATYPAGSLVYGSLEALASGKRSLQLLMTPSARVAVQNVVSIRSGLLVNVLDNVRSRLLMLRPDKDGAWRQEMIELPKDGAVAITSSSSASDRVFVTYEDFLTPITLYEIDGSTLMARQLKRLPPSFRSENFQQAQYSVNSADGTEVPYTVVMAKDVKLDGTNPTYIFSYGGFRNSLTPSYSGSYEDLSGAYGKLWLERGGVFVLANIRGGAEFGPRWHRAALNENRYKAFEDFEAVAEDLIARKITSPQHLGIEGRSNGGLLVASTMIRRPELYGAVVCGAPLLDMRRYNKLLAGASWMAEYGNPDVPEQWEYIKHYSPYQNVRKDVLYPPVLIYTSTRDDRVHPGHARKMTAKMEAMGHIVHYYENLEGGHAGSSTNDQLAYRIALAYSFLWKQLR